MAKLERLGIKMQPKADAVGSFARFNPGCARQGEYVHLLYRCAECALHSKDYVTTIGYAKMDLEGRILEDTDGKLIYPTLPEESRGCEDPRVVWFEDWYYLFYTAFDGELARVAVARTKDFQSIEKLGVIHHAFFDKDAFIFPQRIGGKIAYMHRATNDIQIDYFDSIQDLLHNKIWEDYGAYAEKQTVLRANPETQQKIGGGPPPILTDAGWLLIYHSVDKNSVYRAQAALLDKKNPSKLLAVLPDCLIEPEQPYEVKGDVDNVVFPQGTYVVGDTLYVYYGAADKYIALGKVEIPELVQELLKNKK